MTSSRSASRRSITGRGHHRGSHSGSTVCSFTMFGCSGGRAQNTHLLERHSGIACSGTPPRRALWPRALRQDDDALTTSPSASDIRAGVGTVRTAMSGDPRRGEREAGWVVFTHNFQIPSHAPSRSSARRASAGHCGERARLRHRSRGERSLQCRHWTAAGGRISCGSRWTYRDMGFLLSTNSNKGKQCTLILR